MKDVLKEDDKSLILRAIESFGPEGVLQRILQKKLKMSEKKISRLVTKLEKMGQIKRVKELHARRWTYRLFRTREPSTLDSILGIPCTSCSMIDRCGMRRDISPITCELLSKWVNSEAERQSRSLVQKF